MAARRQRVAVFLGGPSSEHEISLKSGALVLDRLDRQRFEPAPVFVDRDRRWHFAPLPYREGPLDDALAGATVVAQGHREPLPWHPDVAFLGLHGTYGEDGEIQAELDALAVPYTGSGPVASRLAMNKAVAKGVFRRAGLAVPPDFAIAESADPGHEARRIAASHRGPWVVKPRDGGSSVGVQIVTDAAALARALGEALREGPVMIEGFISGRELTCGVLANPTTSEERALPPTEIRPRGGGFFDFNAKYTPGASEELTPAPLTSEETRAVQDGALAAPPGPRLLLLLALGLHPLAAGRPSPPRDQQSTWAHRNLAAAAGRRGGRSELPGPFGSIDRSGAAAGRLFVDHRSLAGAAGIRLTPRPWTQSLPHLSKLPAFSCT